MITVGEITIAIMLLQMQLQYETVEEIAIANNNCNNVYQKVGDITIHQHAIVKKEKLKLKMIV